LNGQILELNARRQSGILTETDQSTRSIHQT
jgi:hypothetical protein